MGANSAKRVAVTFIKKWGTNDRGSPGVVPEIALQSLLDAGYVILGHKNLLTVGQDIPKPQTTPVPTVVVPAIEGAAPVVEAASEKRGPGRPRKV